MTTTPKKLQVFKNRSWEKPPWYSSYEKNNYGELFYSLMRIYQPKKVVELGTKAGYSAYHIARGLQANGKGSLDCYDLWEDYQFHSVPQSTTADNLKEFKDIITLNQRNAIGVQKLYSKIDILHIDLSNQAEILEKIIPRWIDKVRQFIIIEGGSPERDQLDWMIKFKKKPISNWLKTFSKKRSDIQHLTLPPFPSVTLLRKK